MFLAIHLHQRSREGRWEGTIFATAGAARESAARVSIIPNLTLMVLASRIFSPGMMAKTSKLVSTIEQMHRKVTLPFPEPQHLPTAINVHTHYHHMCGTRSSRLSVCEDRPHPGCCTPPHEGVGARADAKRVRGVSSPGTPLRDDVPARIYETTNELKNYSTVPDSEARATDPNAQRPTD